MLIDATHAEETRVVALKGNRLEEFDYESASKKQLKGSIYLAKVTRVEPSLQAAFVDYGGNRHGFLAFNEIHPDYYQIPVADREALLQEEAEQAAQEAAEDDAAAEAEAEGDAAEDEADPPESAEDSDRTDTLEDDLPRPRTRSRRQYKIQEVIKKRQILLVQVVKEERGTKGAALTTYLSLAGRYCVLMPNTARGGGISRKIANQSARRKLKKIVSELDVPEGMGVIVRTAGMSRTKSEIRRDLDYLLRLWDSVRELTMESTAPTMVYEEASLIKRAIRDVYTKDVEEILVEGEDGYRTAKDFMRLLMPSHAKKVQPYRNRIPLFHRYQVEQQLDTMHSNTVHLKSGGYLVINQTEALVAIDVNSGRSTRERNIEETALKTNLEASDEVARQLRLRDLAGLIVIDYIDMEESRNNRSVERRLKDCLKNDRARIQVGRISTFGLLEMSRQRLRPSLFEASSVPCDHCGGTGYMRSTESAALQVLRAIEEEGIRGRAGGLDVSAPTIIALYILNHKRAALIEIESRYGVQVKLLADDDLIVPNFNVDLDTSIELGPRSEEAEAEVAAIEEERQEADSGRKRRRRRGRRKDEARDDDTVESRAQDDETESEQDGGREAASVDDDDTAEKPKRRRRGRRGGRRRRQSDDAETGAEAAADGQADDEQQGDDDSSPSEEAPADTDVVAQDDPVIDTAADAALAEEPEAGDPEPMAATAPSGPSVVEAAAAAWSSAEVPADDAASDGMQVAEAPEDGTSAIEDGDGDGDGDGEPTGLSDDSHVNGGEATVTAQDDTQAEPEQPPEKPDQPKRRGWWQRRSFF